MSSPIGPTDLTKFQSGLKFSDLQNWRHIPASAVVQPTAEMKAELAAREAESKQLVAEAKAEREANPSLFSKNAESNQMVLTNVALVSPDNIHSRISYVTDLIQSGEAEKYDFHSGNGEQATNSIHQYLYWLQQRAADLDSDGTYSPEMFR